jgi:hypothetical protein
MKETLARHGGWAFGLVALVLSASGAADAARQALVQEPPKNRPNNVLRLDSRGKIPAKALPFKVSAKPKKRGVLRLGRNKRFPARAIPTVRNTRRLGGRPARAWRDRCAPETIDMDGWCLMSSFVEVSGENSGRNNYFFATRTCAERGGFLPSAEQLLGAVDRARLAGAIDDNRLTASIDEDGSDGLKDRREMSSTLITTTSGGSAAGSQGVTPGSKGNPRAGEPDPVPAPADPAPDTLHYVTVYDNRDRGGFAGGKEVQEPENFRCAFPKVQGGAGEEIE